MQSWIFSQHLENRKVFYGDSSNSILSIDLTIDLRCCYADRSKVQRADKECGIQHMAFWQVHIANSLFSQFRQFAIKGGTKYRENTTHDSQTMLQPQFIDHLICDDITKFYIRIVYK